ncbi:hypothetical protein PQR01_04870 [Paraburkholderia rhynchosiae]|uniref:Uncharacterized protein n=2 Tax=Paraburkholderia TaxID=1822464 RepID=A0ACC7N6T2_9BURK
MTAIRFPRFLTAYVATAVCLTIGASCALPTPGLMRAFITVGTDVQLPLERVATDSQKPAQVIDLPEPLHTSAWESAHAQSPVHSWKETSHRADPSVPAPSHTPGHQRAITDLKYWT